MHLVIRRISEYTGSHILLGVFRSLEQATTARQKYLSDVVHGDSDPWARQAYHTVSDSDVEILSSVPTIDLDSAQPRVFVVSSYAEGFGQEVRTFEATCGTDISAREHATALEAKDDGSFPYYCDVDEVAVGRFLWVDTATSAPKADDSRP